MKKPNINGIDVGIKASVQYASPKSPRTVNPVAIAKRVKNTSLNVRTIKLYVPQINNIVIAKTLTQSDPNEILGTTSAPRLNSRNA